MKEAMRKVALRIDTMVLHATADYVLQQERKGLHHLVYMEWYERQVQRMVFNQRIRARVLPSVGMAMVFIWEEAKVTSAEVVAVATALKLKLKM